MTGRAVAGPWTGKALRWLPSEVTTWRRWREAHAETTVLLPPEPIESYAAVNAAYDRYREEGVPQFPLGPVRVSTRYPKMDLVTIVVRDGKARCYPHRALKEGESRDGDLRITRSGISVVVRDVDGKQVPSMQATWFAWCVLYEEGTVVSW